MSILFGIAVDGQGNIYLGDNVNNQVLKEDSLQR